MHQCRQIANILLNKGIATGHMQYESIYIRVNSAHCLNIKTKTAGNRIMEFRLTVIPGYGGSKKT